MFSFKFWAATLALVVTMGTAQAVPMVYTYEVIASGQLNGQSFTNAEVTVTLTGDSSVLYPYFCSVCDSSYFVLAETTLIEVAGVGSDSFLNPITAVTSAFEYDGVYFGYIGFSEPVADYGIFFVEYDYLLALDYDLTPLEPVSGGVLGNEGIAFDTVSGGSFTFDSFDSLGTFTAHSVPEPTTLALLLVGLVPLLRRYSA